MTTKIHTIVDALGNPLAVSLTGGHVHDVTQALDIALYALRIPKATNFRELRSHALRE